MCSTSTLSISSDRWSASARRNLAKHDNNLTRLVGASLSLPSIAALWNTESVTCCILAAANDSKTVTHCKGVIDAHRLASSEPTLEARGWLSSILGNKDF